MAKQQCDPKKEAVRGSSLDGQFIVVPSFYIDRPKYTIGLGDSFTGGIQLCF